MTPEEIAARLAVLSQPWCPPELVHELLGIDLPGDPQLAGAFRMWSARFWGDANVERSTRSGRLVHRHALEAFLLQNGWISRKWAACHLGLDEGTLALVVDRLQGSALVPQVASGVSDQILRQRDAASLYRLFPSLRLKAFSSHSSMCRALHDAIRTELGLEFQPLLCVTSAKLDPKEPDIADAFDAINGDPVGVRYQVWLDTGKPVNLRPDVCSLRFYAEHEGQLQAHVMRGSEPVDIDDRLRAA